MKGNVEMSMIGEMKFFLVLQVHQSPRGIFICQLQYTIYILKKHGMEKCDTVITPMATTKLDADLQGTPMDQIKYRSMIGGLMYLTASRPDIAFATFIVKETTIDDTSATMNEVVMEKEVVDMLGRKTISEEFNDIVTLTTATSSKTPSTTTRKKKSFSHTTRNLPGSIPGMCRRRGLIQSHIKNKFITREFFADKIKEVIYHFNTIVPELTVTKTNEIIKKEMPRLVKLVVDKDREVSPIDIYGMVSKEFAAHAQKIIEDLFRQYMQNITLNLYLKSHSSTATTSSADLQQQLYQTMKAKPQDQATDPEI
ncbi:hypothetical protein Tco_1161582 [Tanacetum coccineum]